MHSLGKAFPHDYLDSPYPQDRRSRHHPSSVVWTADAAHQIGQNEYQAFSLSVGILPDEGTTVNLPAGQTYTDGTVVKWNEKTAAGQAEPEHPAPPCGPASAG